jgi:hypothetical protein
MAVEVYSLARDGNKNLTKNFRVSEFRCFDNSDMIKIDTDLVVRLLQPIRDRCGPVSVNSGYRTPEHNALIGGVPTSQHTYGTAADIIVAGVSPMEICQCAEYLMPGKGGIGVYAGFAHVDVRDIRSRWDERPGHAYNTPGFPGYVPPPAPAPALPPPDMVPIVLTCRCGAHMGTVEGMLVNGAAYGPIRAVCEFFGHVVAWDGRQVTVK